MKPGSRVTRVRFVSLDARRSGRQVLDCILTAQISMARLYQLQPHAGDDEIVGGDAAMAFHVASETAVHEHLLAVTPEVRADRRHQAAALAEPVAGLLPVDMLRVQAERAVIAVPSPGDWRSDKRLAMPALELLAARDSLRWGICRFGQAVRPRVPANRLKVVNIVEFLNVVV
jgi:hypothetical protein